MQETGGVLTASDILMQTMIRNTGVSRVGATYTVCKSPEAFRGP